MCYAAPVQPKISTDKIIQRYSHSTWFFYPVRKWFQRFTPTQPEIFSKISLYTTLEQPGFYYISTVWFQDSTSAPPAIFVDDMAVRYTRTTWLPRHLYNLISCFFTCTTGNLYLYGKVTYFTLHSHTLIFITFAKHISVAFSFLLCACSLRYTYFLLIFLFKLSRCHPHDTEEWKQRINKRLSGHCT